MKMHKFGLVMGSLVITTLVFGAVLTSSFASADDVVVDDVVITVPVACTLSGTGTGSHNATINPGTYQADIGTTTLKAFCNDSNGFAIYSAGYTGEIVGETNSNKLVGVNTGETVSTGTATSGNTSAWAMKLNTITNPTPTYPITIDSDTNGSFSSYHVVPNEYVKVAHRDSGTDVGSSATGSELTTTYASFITSTQVADTYSGKVIYTLVHPSNHSAPVICNPNATTISQVKCMQDFANVTSANRTAIVSSMTTGTQYTIKDSRDGKEYTISKLADGNVWMTKNLDLDLDSGTTYTNLDTDIGYNTSTGTYDTAAWRPIRSTYTTTSNHIHEWCAGGTWNSQYGYCENNYTPESYDPGNLYWNTTTSDFTDWNSYYNSCDFTTSTPTCNQSLNPISTYTSSTGTTQYHLGNYYNWSAAVAMNDSSSHTTYGELIEQSICPAGWTLPRTGTGDDTFYALWSQYGYDDNDGFANISTVWSNPLYFAASGSFNGALGLVGSDGGFWSPVVSDSSVANFAGFNTGGVVNPSVDGDRYYGQSVRCVARPVASSGSGEGGGGGPK